MARQATGTIYKRGKSFYLRMKSNGMDRTIKLKASTRAEAEEDAAKYRKITTAESVEEIAFYATMAKQQIKEKMPRETIEQAFSRFESDPTRPHCTEQWLLHHRRVWFDFCQSCGALYIDGITADKAKAYFHGISGTAPAAYNKRLASCKLVWRVIAPEKPSPFAGIRKQRETGQSKTDFSPEQIKDVFMAVDQEYPLAIPHREEYSALFRLLAYTGMRLKDCAMFERQNIGTSTIRATPYKTRGHGITVEIPIHAKLRPFLKPGESVYLLPHIAELYQQGRRYDVDKMVNRIIDYAIPAGERKTYTGKGGTVLMRRPERNHAYGAHSFRHSFISFLLNAGVSEVVVRSFVGHNSRAVTRIYTHIKAKAQQIAIAALPEI